ncbi:MAG TPA: endonuclease domain-containing protein [Chitinophagales bacterium]|nr:endonuclease domain-containing protein [Chitinophagales bacterium]
MPIENTHEDMFFGATPKIFEFAKQLRMRLTPAEEKLWNCISNKKLEVRFRRQHPLNIFIADFYCHKLKLIIELDGGIHNESDQKEYDIGRTEELEKFGISIIRFSNEEVFTDTEKVLKRIRETIRGIQEKSLSHTPKFLNGEELLHTVQLGSPESPKGEELSDIVQPSGPPFRELEGERGQFNNSITE